MTSPRVAHLVFDLIRGGSEGQCARIAMGLARRGGVQRVAVFHRRGFFQEAVEAACGPVHELPIRHAVWPGTVCKIRQFAKWLRLEQIDLLHAWDADAAIFGQFAARLAETGFMTSRRDLGQIYPRWKTVMMRRADRNAICVVANAEAVRDRFVAQGLPENKIVVLPNLLDMEERDRLAAVPFSRAGELPAGRRLVAVNRLDPEKNVGLLIEALPLVRKQVPDAALVVAGAGREMPALCAQAAGLGVAADVCFLGEIHEVPALLPLCEIGALVPIRNEGLSNTILEYMAAGLPVLATDCGGNRELVRDRATGRLVPDGADAAAVARAWTELLRDREAAAAMGRQARREVEQRHALAPVLDQFSDLYARIAELWQTNRCPSAVSAACSH